MTSVRERWYELHRARRVFAREQKKAFSDLVTFGTGAMLVCPEGDPRHIPLKNLLVRAAVVHINPPIIVDPTLPGCV